MNPPAAAETSANGQATEVATPAGAACLTYPIDTYLYKPNGSFLKVLHTVRLATTASEMEQFKDAPPKVSKVFPHDPPPFVVLWGLSFTLNRTDKG